MWTDGGGTVLGGDRLKKCILFLKSLWKRKGGEEVGDQEEIKRQYPAREVDDDL